jgi:hypothetical protein
MYFSLYFKHLTDKGLPRNFVALDFITDRETRIVCKHMFKILR